MIMHVSEKSIRDARLAPAAIVAVAPEWFKTFGIDFVRDEDDLDSYEFACTDVKGLMCGLLRYENAPQDETTILFPDGAPVDRSIEQFARAFDLRLDSFRWQHQGAEDGPKR